MALFLPATVAPAMAWLRLLGLMASMVGLIDFCRPRMRPSQLHLLSYFRPSRHSINLPVPTTPWLTPHLQWWVEDANLTQGRVFRPPRPSATVVTNACLYCWVGGDPRPPPDSGGVGHGTPHNPHQCPGNAGGPQCPPALPGAVSGAGRPVRSDTSSTSPVTCLGEFSTVLQC